MHASPTLVAPRPARVAPPPRPALERDRECLVTGVSAGLGRHLGLPVHVVRLLFLIATVFAGAGILFYLWCWALMPWQQGDAAPSRKAPVAWVLVAAAALGTLTFSWSMGQGRFYVDLNTVLALLLGVVAATAASAWALLIDRADPARGPRHASVVRAASVVLLVVLAFVAWQVSGMLGITALLPLVGLAVVFVAASMHRLRDLSGERIRRIREEQRSEMAAHLHDSVLQTLALIQNRAGASSEAGRLARAQERELRAWLYDGDSPADSDLSTDLRDYAAALELDFPVRIDVVSAGLSSERASGEVAAAAREAMLNAARHAGGEVSVYIEGKPSGVDVFIRDRGAGFDLDAVPSDRLGVRESVIGRMRRAGGSATVRSGETGTEVHLHATGDAHV